MWAHLTDLLREHAQPLHSALKGPVSRWINSGVDLLPVPKRFGGRLVLTHPRYLHQHLDDLDPYVPNWIQSSLHPGETFLDVGANVGFFSMCGCRAVGATGTVFAFEPSAVNRAFLNYHRRINRLRQIRIREEAVANHDDTAQLYLLNDGDSGSNSLTFDRPNLPRLRGEVPKVATTKCIKLDTFCDQEQVVPAAIKIDVEGAELLVLQGASKTITRHRPTIILAVHPEWLPVSQSIHDIDAFLRAHKYSITSPSGKTTIESKVADYLCRPD